VPKVSAVLTLRSTFRNSSRVSTRSRVTRLVGGCWSSIGLCNK
jgi:hypothetical protein